MNLPADHNENILMDLVNDITGSDITVSEIKQHFNPREVKIFIRLAKEPHTVNDLERRTGINIQTIRKYVKQFERRGLIIQGDFIFREGYRYHLNKDSFVNHVTRAIQRPVEKLADFHFFSSHFGGKEVTFEQITYSALHPKNPVTSGVTAVGLAMGYLWYKSYKQDDDYGEITKEDVMKMLEEIRHLMLDEAEMLLRIIQHPFWQKKKPHLLLDDGADSELMRELAEGFIENWGTGRISRSGVTPTQLEYYTESIKKQMKDDLEVD